MSEPKVAVWRRWDAAGIEHCTLAETAAGYRLAGVVVLVAETTPCRLDYEVDCDSAWRTGRASMDMVWGTARRSLTLRVDADAGWWVDEEARPDLAGCLDVDLGFSPSTNTLPIQRLRLAVGGTADVDTAWVRFPALDVQRGPQRYSRLADRVYRYEGLDSGFTADVVVDADGLVVSYPPGWTRL